MTESKEVLKANEIITKFDITEEKLPVDIDSILNDFKIIWHEADLPDNISGVLDTRTENPIILVNQFHSEARKRFSKAHELGHFLLQKEFDGLRVDKQMFFRNELSKKGIDSDEIEANRFAAALLMPEKILSNILFNTSNVIDTEDDDIILNLAKKFGVSVSALSIRIGKLVKALHL